MADHSTMVRTRDPKDPIVTDSQPSRPGRTIRIEPGPAERNVVAHARRVRLQNRALGVITPIVFLAVWEWLSGTGRLDSRFYPPPSDIAATARTMIGDGTLQADMVVTLRGFAIGFTIGFTIGAITGVILGSSRLVRAALEPLLTAFYTIPKLALLPPLLLIFGIGETPKIALVALGVFFITWINLLEAILAIPPAYAETARSFNASRALRMWRVTLPAVLPQVFIGLRIAVGYGILVLIGVEMVSGNQGIGYRIWNSWTLFAADRMYVGIVLAALLGLVLTKVVEIIGRVTTPWAPKSSPRQF